MCAGSGDGSGGWGVETDVTNEIGGRGRRQGGILLAMQLSIKWGYGGVWRKKWKWVAAGEEEWRWQGGLP